MSLSTRINDLVQVRHVATKGLINLSLVVHRLCSWIFEQRISWDQNIGSDIVNLA